MKTYLSIISVLEKNAVYENLLPDCEPQLGKRDLYPTLGSQKKTADFVNAVMWVLNLSDGTNDLIEISERSGMNFEIISGACDALLEKGLLRVK